MSRDDMSRDDIDINEILGGDSVFDAILNNIIQGGNYNSDNSDDSNFVNNIEGFNNRNVGNFDQANVSNSFIDTSPQLFLDNPENQISFNDGQRFSTSNYSPVGADTLTAGLSYTFAVSVAYIPVNSKLRPTPAIGTITVNMNAPPICATIYIDPKRDKDGYGTALSTVFNIRTYQWTDDVADYPILYSFSYYISDSNSQISLRSFGQTPFLSSKLGQGLFIFDYKTWCVGFAADVYGAVGNVTTRVTVLPLPKAGEDDIKNLAATASSNLESAFNSTDASTVTSTVGAITTTLNTVDCDTPTKCPDLNRLECVSTPNTCGMSEKIIGDWMSKNKIKTE
jgi:hypothetical protein